VSIQCTSAASRRKPNVEEMLIHSVSTLRSALELKAVFEKLQAAEHSGLSPEQLRKLEEQAAEQGIRTLWKGAKLEVESVVREAADKVLSDPAVSAEKRHLRAIALGYMAEVCWVSIGLIFLPGRRGHLPESKGLVCEISTCH
jgi:hypothetical protein